MDNSVGYLKLYTWVIVGKDKHGRERGKRVSLLSHHCDFAHIDMKIAEFVKLNPNYSKLTVEAEFIARDAMLVRFPSNHVGIPVRE
jgi:hypothetical protein